MASPLLNEVSAGPRGRLQENRDGETIVEWAHSGRDLRGGFRVRRCGRRGRGGRRDAVSAAIVDAIVESASDGASDDAADETAFRRAQRARAMPRFRSGS